MHLQTAFNQFIRKKRLKNLSDKTIENYIAFVSPFVNHFGASFDIQNLTTEDILTYIDGLFCKNIADATRATYIRHLKIFLRWMKDCYNIPVALSEIEIPRTGKKIVYILSDEDIRHLFSSIECENEWLQLRNCAIVSLMLGSGLRQSEVVTLKWLNIHFDQDYAIVSGKGEKVRCVPMGAVIRNFLLEYKKLCPFRSEYVFVSRRGDPITNNTIKQLIQKLKKKSGIDFSSHKLRHNFATNYCMDSLERTGQCDAYTLQVLLGHENVKTTEKYLHYARSMVAAKNNHDHLDQVFGLQKKDIKKHRPQGFKP